MTPNQIIHTAMGLGCWHKYVRKYATMAATFGFVCSECENLAWSHHSDGCDLNPDYSQPEHIGKVYAWMREQHDMEGGRWSDFLRSIMIGYGMEPVDFLYKPEDQQILLIAAWITEG